MGEHCKLSPRRFATFARFKSQNCIQICYSRNSKYIQDIHVHVYLPPQCHVYFGQDYLVMLKNLPSLSTTFIFIFGYK